MIHPHPDNRGRVARLAGNHPLRAAITARDRIRRFGHDPSDGGRAIGIEQKRE
jgi:hypothetical protein